MTDVTNLENGDPVGSRNHRILPPAVHGAAIAGLPRRPGPPTCGDSRD